ncbi:putative uncharacterized protein DDB_G0272516 [Diaphorina citri]|uniref:Uncharacterized protein n=1 Tax=Diaphorina citri TaxID=121845 RepID=A0A3Q0IHM0_DIACI|nr:putative uncharacterized protein DDB_G0272516 [Diaphorina citri]
MSSLHDQLGKSKAKSNVKIAAIFAGIPSSLLCWSLVVVTKSFSSVTDQLGKSKTKSNVSHDKANDNLKEHLTKSSTSTTPCPTTDKSSTRYETPTTNPTLYESRAENEINQDRKEVTEKETNDEKENPNSKPTWPDIFKNEYEKLFWNAENIYDEEMSDEDDEDEENYFSEYQWDEEDKSVNNNVNSLNSDEDASKASKTNVNRKENRENINISKASRVNNVNNGVNNKYEFVHFLNSAITSTVRTVVTNVTNHNDVQKDNGDNTGARDDNWPNFSYHRVTVNPKEKFKNLSKAFIVVSEISPKHNETITKSNENSIQNHSHETHMKVLQRGEDSVRKESVAESETSLHSRGDTHLKEKIFRHHWRDKPKHSKRRHHRTHSHHVTPSPDY